MAAPRGQPERQTRPDIVVEGEKLQLFPEFAVVALLRFLEHGEVFVELGLVLEGGAVDALELRILFVAFVVGAGHVRETKGADVASAHDMRPGAEIREIAVAIDRDRLVLRNVLDDIELELARFGSRTEGAKFTTVRPLPGRQRGRVQPARSDGLP